MAEAPPGQTTDPLGLDMPVPTGGGLFDEIPWKPPIRLVRDPETGQQIEYGGPGIISSNGMIVRNDDGTAKLEYDLRTEPRLYYLTTPSAKLESVLDTLKAMGARVDTPEYAVNAIGDLMLFANNFGRDIDTTLRELQTRAPMFDEAPRYRVSSSKDLRIVFNETAKQALGRKFSEEELQRAIRGYQSAEIGVQATEAGTVESVASPQAYAQDFAQQTAPTEAKAYKYLDYANLLFKSLGRVQ